MNDWLTIIAEELKEELFYRVDTKQLAETLQKKGKERSFWYERILPREAADRLYEKTGGDYLQIWHEHCYGYCGNELNAASETVFYATKEKDIFLCENCFKELKPYLSKENKNL